MDFRGIDIDFSEEEKSGDVDPSMMKIKVSFESPKNLGINGVLEVGNSWGVYRAFETLMHLMTPSRAGIYPLRIAHFKQKTNEKGFLCGELQLEVSNLKEVKKDDTVD